MLLLDLQLEILRWTIRIGKLIELFTHLVHLCYHIWHPIVVQYHCMQFFAPILLEKTVLFGVVLVQEASQVLRDGVLDLDGNVFLDKVLDQGVMVLVVLSL